MRILKCFGRRMKKCFISQLPNCHPGVKKYLSYAGNKANPMSRLPLNAYWLNCPLEWTLKKKSLKKIKSK
jgi:hypothetical protein